MLLKAYPKSWTGSWALDPGPWTLDSKNYFTLQPPPPPPPEKDYLVESDDRPITTVTSRCCVTLALVKLPRVL